MKKAYGYCRVSTKRQGRSKLGLKFQERTLRNFCAHSDIKPIDVFIEIASGLNNNRPILKKTLDLCKKHKASLIVPSIDRFSRNCAFTTMHLESELELILADNPGADKFLKQILAAVAEKESASIAKRTTGGLYETKLKGTKLGNANPLLQKKRREAWKRFVARMKPKIRRYWMKGYNSVRSLTDILNANGVKTFFGNDTKWHVSTVHRLLKELNY